MHGFLLWFHISLQFCCKFNQYWWSGNWTSITVRFLGWSLTPNWHERITLTLFLPAWVQPLSMLLCSQLQMADEALSSLFCSIHELLLFDLGAAPPTMLKKIDIFQKRARTVLIIMIGVSWQTSFSGVYSRTKAKCKSEWQRARQQLCRGLDMH